MGIKKLIPVRLLATHLRQPTSCASQDDFKQWVSSYHRGRRFGPDPHETLDCGFCSDCTPEFQARMMREEKCDHFLEVVFDQDGTPGLLPYDERIKLADAIACEVMGL